MIPRKQAVQTEEVANVAAFLLSPRSSGINAQRIVVDAGMSINYFDRRIIEKAVGNRLPGPKKKYVRLSSLTEHPSQAGKA